MSRPAPIITANDNEPLKARPTGDAVGFRALLRDKDVERRLHKLELQQIMQNERTDMAKSQTIAEEYTPITRHIAANESVEGRPNSALVFSLLIMLGATLAAAYTFYSAQSAVISVAALTALVWSALWTIFQSKDEDSTIIAEVSTGIATIAGLGVWVIAAREWGLSISAADGAAGLCILAVVAAALLGSRLSLLMSVCAGLVWLMLYTQFPTLNRISIWLYPLLVMMQAFCAGAQQAKVSTTLAMIGGHIWLVWILFEHIMMGDISWLHASAIGMMIGLAHYRLGKAAGDKGWVTANSHMLFGWALAIIGATALQNYWLGQNPDSWSVVSATPFGDLSWQLVGAASLALIGIAGIIRMTHRQMTTLSVLCSLGTALCAAALFDQRETISQFVTVEFGTPAKPLIGLLIGAAILASAVAMCLNGARRKNMVMMLAGLCAIAVQLAVMLKPQLWTADVALLFGLGLLTSLSLAALFSAEARVSDYAR